jgi:biotin transporter BioY
VEGFGLRLANNVETSGVMNWLSIVCAALAFWILGFVWYSLLFGKMWTAALQQHGIKLQPGGMAPKLLGTFIGNLVAAIVMQHLLARIGNFSLVHGLRFGLGAGIGFSATTITLAYLWQQQPLKVWVIDVSYYVLGAVLLGVILSAWH